eukprot:scaffold16462_cov78-Skeletonema_dohrnii-CCMP3373.AAC.5
MSDPTPYMSVTEASWSIIVLSFDEEDDCDGGVGDDDDDMARIASSSLPHHFGVVVVFVSGLAVPGFHIMVMNKALDGKMTMILTMMLSDEEKRKEKRRKEGRQTQGKFGTFPLSQST